MPDSACASLDIVPDVAQEAEAARRKLLSEIESLTGRNVLNYSATAVGAPGEIMFAPDILNLTRVMHDDRESRGVDLILNSPGGAPEIAEKIVSTLRNFYDDKLRVIVPESAKSAATIVCLGADEILMGYCSELGPIDPQMLTKDGAGNVQFRSAHAIIESIDRYVRDAHDALANQKPFHAFVRLLDFHPDLAFVEECRLAVDLAKGIAERLLAAGMLRADPARAKTTADTLSSAQAFLSHGRAIDHRFAHEKLGLKVTYLEPNVPLWKKVWEVHVRSHLSHYQPMGCVKIVESSRTTLAFRQ